MNATPRNSGHDRPRQAFTHVMACAGVGFSLAILTSTRPADAAIPQHLAAEPTDADHSSPITADHHRTFGMSMDVGVPDGAALGLVVRPYVSWIRLAASATHNGIAPGARAGLTLDPIAFPAAPTFTVEGGHYWQGNIPGVSAAPAIGYNYANLHLGLEFGNRESFRFFLRGGASWLDVRGAQTLNSIGSGIGNTAYSGWLTPSAKLGFSLYF